MNLPDHVQRNRDAWTKMSAAYEEPGRKAWQTEVMDWGIWGIPESEVGAFKGIELAGKDVIELGCGTAYFSAWLQRLGARPVGIDITPAQLDKARAFQSEFGRSFPLLEGSAEEVPYPDRSFDIALSEYGASIWCDPYVWIREAARLLRPGGHLIFLRNSTISVCCMPDEGAVKDSLQRDWFGMHRIEWSDDKSVEFHLNPGDMLRLLRANGFEVEDLIYLQPKEGVSTRFEFMTAEWGRRWPAEEIWRARLKA